MPARKATGAPQSTSCQFSDTEQVRSFYADEYSACVAVNQPVPGSRFHVGIVQLHLGPLEITEHRRSVEMAFRTERDDAYIICVASAGSLDLEQRDAAVAGTPTTAAVYQPVAGPALIRTGAPSRVRGLLVQRWTLAAHLELLLDHPVPPAIAMAPTIDLGTGGGRAWLNLVDLFTDALGDPDHVVFSPLVSEPLSDALVNGLLMIADHPYTDVLRQPATACRPRHVKAAIDRMHESPDHPHTTASLAQITGVGIRHLQSGFRRHLNMSPMAYLRQLRLTRAHDDLRSGRAATVAEAAHRWGFAHLGRFAADYRMKYGEPPSGVRREHIPSRRASEQGFRRVG